MPLGSLELQAPIEVQGGCGPQHWARAETLGFCPMFYSDYMIGRLAHQHGKET